MSQPSNRRRDQPLVWMDLEMSGLDPDACEILEIATIVTDGELNVVAEGPALVIHQPDRVLDTMEPWCVSHHGKSGLTDQVRSSPTSLRQAERLTVDFLREHCKPGRSPLCGNSIGQDRRFLYRHMPALQSYLYYRNIDVSTIKELVVRWYPEVVVPPKRDSHRALEDIKDSIDELRFYRDHVFRGPAGFPKR